MKELNRVLRVLKMVLLMFAFAPCESWGQPTPPPLPSGQLLNVWLFSGTNYLSLRRSAPLSLTNVALVPTWAGNGLQVDSTNAAWITYAVVETNGHTNLDCLQGSVETWYMPSSSNRIANWGTLLEVGTWSTNATGAWGLYLDNSNIWFAAQSNGFSTNYLSAPINWNPGEWHHIMLTYSATNSSLYLEGQLVTNGPGVSIVPGPDVISNGFSIGSDGNLAGTGLRQAHGIYNQLISYNYQMDADTIAENYAYDTQYVFPLPSSGGRLTMNSDSGPPTPPGDGSDTNSGGTGTTYYAPQYGSNDFWMEALSLGTNAFNADPNSLTMILHGTIADIDYQILSTTNLQASNTVWTLETEVLGSEITNFTAATVPLGTNGQKFFKALAYTLDTTGDGLPDWWQLKYYGHLGVDPYADPAGDGYSNLQKYQMGVAPNVWVTPQAPSGITSALNANGTSATLTWNPSLGNVTGYTVYVSTNTNPVWWGSDASDFSVLTNLPANQSSFTDSTEDFANGVEYKVQANYGGNSSTLSGSFNPAIEPDLTTDAHVVRGPGGHPYLVVSAMPPGVAAYRVFYGDEGTYFEDTWYPILDNNPQNLASVSNAFFDIPVSQITNGVCPISDGQIPLYAGEHFRVQAVGTNGYYGNILEDTNWGWGAYRGSYTPYLGWADVSANIPFIDGRANIAQNINFLLRAGEAFYPFQVSGVGSTSFQDSSQSNYVSAGFHYYWQPNGAPYQVNLDEFLPFEENAMYAQFCYSLNTLSPDGFLTNGVYPFNGIGTEDEPGVSPGCPFPFDTYGFVSAGNTNAPAGVLTSSATQWIYYANWQDQGEDLWPTDPYFTQVTLEAGNANIYGLAFGPAICGDSIYSPQFSIVPLGATVPGVPVASFYDVAQPNLQTVGYLFARPNIDILPGQPGFNVTNTTPSPLIIPFGQYSVINAWAKQSIANGYADKFAYPEQYFDKAYLADSNGNITTNQAGILSEYGEFFPMQPGKVFLTTKPDAATGSVGTNVVNVIKLQLDVNHDSIMDLSFAGPDNTSADRPFLFWVNNDEDIPSVAHPTGVDVHYPSHPDYSVPTISSQRDLEDYARLWIVGLPALPTNYQATLSWNVISGNPAINLVQAVETNGGTLYLTETNIAAEQSDGIPSYKIGKVTPTQSYDMGSVLTNGLTNCFLFEGAGIGKGELVLTISQNGTNIASTSTFIDLHDVKDFYERLVITNNTSGFVSNWTCATATVQYASASPLGEDTNILVYAHGGDNSEWQWLARSDTMFKRLYWSGYHGKFGSVRWPSPILFSLNFGRDWYNNTEVIGYKSALPFSAYAIGLKNRFPGYRLHVWAHSAGGPIASEALRLGAPFDTLILASIALPASCYDVNAPTNADLVAADVVQPTPEWQMMGYHGAYTNLPGRVVNYFNTADSLLVDDWLNKNQLFLKPSRNISEAYFFDGTNSYCNPLPPFGTGSSYMVTDSQESRAMVSRSRTSAIGATAPAPGQTRQGVILSTVDLQVQFGLGTSDDEHGAFFTRPIQSILPYYYQVMSDCQIQRSQQQ